jgi:hypothetical protein
MLHVVLAVHSHCPPHYAYLFIHLFIFTLPFTRTSCPV